MRAMILPDEFIDHDSRMRCMPRRPRRQGYRCQVFDALGKDYKAETVKLA